MKYTALFALLLLAGTAFAHGTAELAEAKSIIDSGAACSSLTDDQLKLIGEYYMEQMHPGEQHELMDRMMGLTEGSPQDTYFHVLIARRIYCGETGSMGYGMMGGMMGMMDYGTMGGYGGMMGGTAYPTIVSFLFLLLVIGLVAAVYLWVYKLWREVSGKKK